MRAVAQVWVRLTCLEADDHCTFAMKIEMKEILHLAFTLLLLLLYNHNIVTDIN